METLFFALCSAVSIASFLYSFLNSSFGEPGQERQKVQERVEHLLSRPAATRDIARRAQFSNIALLNRMFRRKRITQNLSQLLAISGWSIPVSVFLFALALWGLLVYLLVVGLTQSQTAALGIALAMSSIPYFFLIIKKKLYISKFTQCLPDALVMMRNSLLAGQGIQAAFKIVAEEGPAPINKEFSQMIREIELGSQMNEALSALYRRIPTTDLRIFIIGTFIQQEVGGNMAELFQGIEKTIRERITQFREMKALTAQGKISGIVLILLPLFVGGFLLILNPSYFTPMMKEEVGRNFLKFAFVMQVIGATVIWKMTSRSLVG